MSVTVMNPCGHLVVGSFVAVSTWLCLLKCKCDYETMRMAVRGEADDSQTV